MMTVAEFMVLLASRMPLDRAASWDPIGLQLGDREAIVNRVAVCHEVTPAVVSKAEEAGVDVLVSYHPLLFRPTTSLTAGSSATGRAFRLIRAGVALVVVHTAFDVAAGGAADALAGSLGLEAVGAFGPLWPAEQVKVVTFVPRDSVDSVVHAMSEAGAGTIGRYTSCAFEVAGTGRFAAPSDATPFSGQPGTENREDESRIEMIAPKRLRDAVVGALVAAHPYEEPPFDVYALEANAGFLGRVGTLPEPLALGEFARRVERRLGGVVRVAGDHDKIVRRVACIPGSGGSFLDAAAADVILTGDVSHHQAQAAVERGVAVVDPGHAATERPGIAKLYAAVSEVAPEAADLTADPSPWRQP